MHSFVGLEVELIECHLYQLAGRLAKTASSSTANIFRVVSAPQIPNYIQNMGTLERVATAEVRISPTYYSRQH
eukprot:2843721-Amphidinium_carterae.2